MSSSRQPNLQQETQRIMRGEVELSERWVRVKHAGQTIAESRMPLLLIQFGPAVMPTYFFTTGEINMDLLKTSVDRDGKRFWSLAFDGHRIEDAAWTYLEPPEHLSPLSRRITFDWDKLDWYEEAEQVYVHARDPHKRVDVLASTRHVQIKLGGQLIADTSRPFLLFETGLPTRYYLPPTDVRLQYLQETAYSTRCPYKGEARYWTITAGDERLENGAWSYSDPIVENPKIKDLICFFNEKVDVYVDGEHMPRPVTPWS